MRRIASIGLLAALCATSAVADDFWDKQAAAVQSSMLGIRMNEVEAELKARFSSQPQSKYVKQAMGYYADEMLASLKQNKRLTAAELVSILQKTCYAALQTKEGTDKCSGFARSVIARSKNKGSDKDLGPGLCNNKAKGAVVNGNVLSQNAYGLVDFCHFVGKSASPMMADAMRNSVVEYVRQIASVVPVCGQTSQYYPLGSQIVQNVTFKDMPGNYTLMNCTLGNETRWFVFGGANSTVVDCTTLAARNISDFIDKTVSMTQSEYEKCAKEVQNFSTQCHNYKKDDLRAKWNMVASVNGSPVQLSCKTYKDDAPAGCPSLSGVTIDDLIAGRVKVPENELQSCSTKMSTLHGECNLLASKDKCVVEDGKRQLVTKSHFEQRRTEEHTSINCWIDETVTSPKCKEPVYSRVIGQPCSAADLEVMRKSGNGILTGHYTSTGTSRWNDCWNEQTKSVAKTCTCAADTCDTAAGYEKKNGWCPKSTASNKQQETLGDLEPRTLEELPLMDGAPDVIPGPVTPTLNEANGSVYSDDGASSDPEDRDGPRLTRQDEAELCYNSGGRLTGRDRCKCDRKDNLTRTVDKKSCECINAGYTYDKPNRKCIPIELNLEAGNKFLQKHEQPTEILINRNVVNSYMPTFNNFGGNI